MASTDKNEIAYGNLWQLFKAVFGIHADVSRRFYIVVGFGLMLFKYLVEAMVIFKATGMVFDPISFLLPSMTYRDAFFQVAPQWLPWGILIWSLPFVWIAVTMSIRRAIDANQHAIVGLLVLIPVLNLFVMFNLALAPSMNGDTSIEEEARRRGMAEFEPSTGSKNGHPRHFVFSAIAGVAIGGLFSLMVTIISANMLHNYGASLFTGMPLVAGAAAGFVYNQPYTKGIMGSLGVGALSVMIGGLGLLLFALEGVICLVMASPLLAPLGAMGGFLGWFLSTVIIKQSKWMLGGATLLLVPVVGILELATTEYETQMVESSIVIDALPEAVWENVVAFPDIDSPQPWYFRWGVASPLRARIEGAGVGAVRHCEFTTGSFVEPITVWDKPNRLAFDVSDQPDPLIELTPYRNVRPPHLSHSFYSVQGEFELVANADGTTKLIGRTWYVVEMGPQIYWKLWTDEIIHRIHMRVLNHIAKTTVNDANPMKMN